MFLFLPICVVMGRVDGAEVERQEAPSTRVTRRARRARPRSCSEYSYVHKEAFALRRRRCTRKIERVTRTRRPEKRAARKVDPPPLLSRPAPKRKREDDDGGPAPKKKVASRAEVVDLLRKVDENLSAPVEDDDDDVVDLTV